MNNIYHTASSCQQFEFQICGRTSESQPSLINQYTNQNPKHRLDITILVRKFKFLDESSRYAAGYLEISQQTGCSDLPVYDNNISFFYLVNLRTKFYENFDRIPDLKNLGQGFEDQSANPSSNPRPDITTFGREFQMCGRTFKIQILDTM